MSKVTESEIEQQQERRCKANRRLVLWFQAMAAFFTAMIYLNQVTLTHFPFMIRSAGLLLIFVAAPPILPYAISAVHTWHLAMYSRIRVAIFLLVVVAGAYGVCGALLGPLDLAPDTHSLLGVFAVQALIYLGSAALLFDGL